MTAQRSISPQNRIAFPVESASRVINDDRLLNRVLAPQSKSRHKRRYYSTGSNNATLHCANCGVDDSPKEVEIAFT